MECHLDHLLIVDEHRVSLMLVMIRARAKHAGTLQEL